ncbi:ABC transporter substrate-binding protein [Brachybacterium sp. AOP42-B2-9]|uniref:ABC transporter substrate-binding protein n=1 Tax=Brachybacterium sp. AOP42-B2-9 TaxID=3457672 RepID=UPI00403316DA
MARRTLMGGLGLGAGLSLLPACTQRPSQSGGGSDGGGGVNLGVSWWGSEERDKATIAALKVITDKRGWTFTTDYGDWGSYWDKVTTQFSGGTAPDVVSMNAPNEIVDFSQRGALLSLDDLIGDKLDVSALTEEEAAPGIVDGTTYGITLATSCPALIYNKTKLDELGLTVPESWTWEEFGQFATEIHEKSGGDLYGSQDNTEGVPLEWFAMQRGYPGLYDGNSLALTEEDFVDWFTYWADLRENGGTVTAEINAADDGSHPNNPVVKGTAAIGMGFNISVDVWAGLTEDELGYAHIPSDNPDVTGNYLGAAALFSINAETEFVDEAAEFISMFISDPEVCQALGFTRGMPNATAVEALGGDLEPGQEALATYSTSVAEGQLSSPPSAPTKSADVGALIAKYADEASFGNMSPEEAATTLYAEAAKIELGS